MYKPILLMGAIGSGKSTVARMITEQFPCYQESSFAEPMKQFAVNIGFKSSEIYGNQNEKLVPNEFYGVSGRYFLQKFGTELCREYLPSAIPNVKLNGRSIWTCALEIKLLKTQQSNIGMVISDGRFPDEVKLVKDYNGLVIKIIRNESDHEADHLSESYDHASDITLYNNGDLELLEKKINKILTSMLNKNSSKDVDF